MPSPVSPRRTATSRAGASATYEALLQRCRASARHPYLNAALIALAALRSRQGDHVAADELYAEAIRRTLSPWLAADALVGQAAAARRLGELNHAKVLLDAAARRTQEAAAPAGHPRVLAGLAWWALGAGDAAAAGIFASDAVAAAEWAGTRRRSSSPTRRSRRLPTRSRIPPAPRARLPRAGADPDTGPGAPVAHRRAGSVSLAARLAPAVP